MPITSGWSYEFGPGSHAIKEAKDGQFGYLSSPDKAFPYAIRFEPLYKPQQLAISHGEYRLTAAITLSAGDSSKQISLESYRPSNRTILPLCCICLHTEYSGDIQTHTCVVVDCASKTWRLEQFEGWAGANHVKPLAEKFDRRLKPGQPLYLVLNVSQQGSLLTLKSGGAPIFTLVKTPRPLLGPLALSVSGGCKLEIACLLISPTSVRPPAPPSPNRQLGEKRFSRTKSESDPLAEEDCTIAAESSSILPATSVRSANSSATPSRRASVSFDMDFGKNGRLENDRVAAITSSPRPESRVSSSGESSSSTVSSMNRMKSLETSLRANVAAKDCLQNTALGVSQPSQLPQQQQLPPLPPPQQQHREQQPPPQQQQREQEPEPKVDDDGSAGLCLYMRSGSLSHSLAADPTVMPSSAIAPAITEMHMPAEVLTQPKAKSVERTISRSSSNGRSDIMPTAAPQQPVVSHGEGVKKSVMDDTPALDVSNSVVQPVSIATPVTTQPSLSQSAHEERPDTSGSKHAQATQPAAEVEPVPVIPFRPAVDEKKDPQEENSPLVPATITVQARNRTITKPVQESSNLPETEPRGEPFQASTSSPKSSATAASKNPPSPLQPVNAPENASKKPPTVPQLPIPQAGFGSSKDVEAGVPATTSGRRSSISPTTGSGRIWASSSPSPSRPSSARSSSARFRAVPPGHQAVIDAAGRIVPPPLPSSTVSAPLSSVINKTMKTGATTPMFNLGYSTNQLKTEKGGRIFEHHPYGADNRQPRPTIRDADPGMVDLIMSEVVVADMGVSFDDVACPDSAKRLLQEAVVLPLLIPEVFTGIREPWKGVLLFGPPGTGKTLLARAAASVSGVTFLNVTSATLTSKWRGDSEKLVRTLFAVAQQLAPSIIFIDEVDALVSSRDNDPDSEASRRFKSELLQQMDGIVSGGTKGCRSVMVLASTNCPWDLDPAIRRRLERRVYMPLPDTESRALILKHHLKETLLSSDVDLNALADRLAGYSGADIKLICRDAAMQPVRKLLAGRTASEIQVMRLNGAFAPARVAVGNEDFDMALAASQPSVASSQVQRYEDWDKEFAAT